MARTVPRPGKLRSVSRSNSLTHSWMSPDKLNGLATQAVIFHYMREMPKNRPSRTSSACCISLHGSCHVSLNSINHIQWKSKLMFQGSSDLYLPQASSCRKNVQSHWYLNGLLQVIRRESKIVQGFWVPIRI